MPYNPDAESVRRPNRPLHRNVKLVCKWCKIPVMSRTDHSAILGHEHKRSCPRSRRGK